MGSDQIIPVLMFATLGAGIVLAIWQMSVFLKSRRNRDIMKNVAKD